MQGGKGGFPGFQIPESKMEILGILGAR